MDVALSINGALPIDLEPRASLLELPLRGVPEHPRGEPASARCGHELPMTPQLVVDPPEYAFRSTPTDPGARNHDPP